LRQLFRNIIHHPVSLERLLVQVKHEFNASNKVLYGPENLLAEGKL